MGEKSRIKKPTSKDLELIEELNPRLRKVGLELIGPKTMRRIGRKDFSAERQLSLEDIEPQESDFLLVTVRATSQAIIDNGCVCMDFTGKGVLESSVDFYKPKGLKKVPVFTQHNWSVTSAIGWIENAFFSEKDAGIEYAGVNNVFRIDAKANMDIARGLKSGVINAISVTDEWDFERSHDELNDFEFWSMMGREVEGEIVRLIVTEYERVYESSLVGLGADENARVLGVRWAGEGPQDKGIYEGAPDKRFLKGSRSMVILKDVEPTKPTGGTRESDDAKKKEVAMSTSISLATLGAFFDGEFDSEDAVAEYARKHKAEHAKLKVERDEAKKKLADLEPLAKAGEEFAKQLRGNVMKAAEAIYVSRNEKFPDDERKEIEGASIADLQRMQKVYGARMGETLADLKIVCSKCKEKLPFGDFMGRSSVSEIPLLLKVETEKPETKREEVFTEVFPSQRGVGR